MHVELQVQGLMADRSCAGLLTSGNRSVEGRVLTFAASAQLLTPGGT